MSAVDQLGWLARRSVLNVVRRPEALAPAFGFPLILLALCSAGMRDFAEVPGFPADSYLDFALAGAVVQAAMVGAVVGGAGLAGDVESGLLARMALTSTRRGLLLLGHFAGSAALAGVAAGLYLAVGLAFGVDVHGGVGGGLAIVVLAVLTALAFGAVCAALALATGSSEAIQGMFPLFFTLLTISTFFTPRDLMESGWFRRLATANPLSSLIDGMRALVIEGWEPAAAVRAAGVAVAIGAASGTAALVALHGRLGAR